MFDHMKPQMPAIDPNIQRSLQKTYDQRQLAAAITESSTAEQVYIRLLAMIQDYQNMIAQDQDVAMSLVNFGVSYTIAVESLGYSGYDLILFGGKDADGKPLLLVQHKNQLSFLLKTVSKEPDVPKRKIGFIAGYQ